MASDRLEELPVVPKKSRERLNGRELVDYEHHRKKLFNWMLDMGKNPDRAKGYSEETVRARAYSLDRFYNWVWDEEGGYTTRVTTDHADQFTRDLVHSDHSRTHKANLQKSLKMLFRWRGDQFGEDPHWDPSITFADQGNKATPRDFLTREERKLIREAALEYGSVPHYNAVDPSERRKWKRLLARRYGLPMKEVGKQEFERANGFKIPSLVWVSIDAGLRPIEVERARVGWIDVENSVLRIPADESAKNEESWTVSLRDKTADFLDLWIQERQLYDKYGDTELLWLTRQSNPYQSTSLKNLLQNLCDIAGIPYEDRQMTWYSIRHSVGTYMAREEGLAAAAAQLRHKSIRTTMKYDQAPPEDRRDALDRMG